MRTSRKVGQRYGALVIKSLDSKTRSGRKRWYCLCDCGNGAVVQDNNLQSGNTRSCGCQSSQKSKSNPRNFKHGFTNTPTYRSWDSMKMRTTNPNKDSYPLYGGRGITVCERWNSFQNFLEDMGMRPSQDYCLSRLDHNGNYEPGNVEWGLKTDNCRDAARRMHERRMYRT